MQDAMRESVVQRLSPPADHVSFPSERLLAGVVVALTALVYLPSLRFGFVLDDYWQLIENQLIQSWRFVPGYFAGHVWQNLGDKVPANYYRPLDFVWFRLVDALAGSNPVGWHLAAILLHVLATFLAYCVARRVTGRPLAAAAAGLLFGIHPMRHEVVGWVSGSTESLCAAFCFGAFLCYLVWRERSGAPWMIASGALYGAALLSKESAILLPAAVFAHAWLYRGATDQDAGAVVGIAGSRWVAAAKPALAYVPVAAAYLAARMAVLRGFSHPKAEVSWSTLFFSLPSAVLFYARQWLLPNRASEYYGLSLQTRFDVAHVLAPLFFLAALAYVLWLVRGKLGRRDVAFAVVWMVATLLPALDLGVFPPDDIVHDRYFYLAGFGAALLVALAIERVSRSLPSWGRVFGLPRNWLALTTVVMVLLSYGTVKATGYWASPYTLFEHSMRFAPANAVLRNNYAVTLAVMGHDAYERGDWPAAESFFGRALQIDPGAADTYLQLGMVDLHTGRAEQAATNLRAAVGLRPAEPMYRFVLGIALAQQNDCAAARAQFAQALALRPGFNEAQRQMDACVAADRPDASGATPSARSDRAAGSLRPADFAAPSRPDTPPQR